MLLSPAEGLPHALFLLRGWGEALSGRSDDLSGDRSSSCWRGSAARSAAILYVLFRPIRETQVTHRVYMCLLCLLRVCVYEPFRVLCLLRVWFVFGSCLRMFIATQIALAKRLSPHNADARLQLSGLRYTDRSGAAQLQDVPPAIAPLAHDRRVASGPPRVPVACVGVPQLVLLVPPRRIRTASAARAAGHAHSYQPGHALSRKRRTHHSAASEQQRGK